ncbi:MAG TPA: ATP-binding cassette domain-containing protein [Caulobacteraceae bacterium]|nr:ATP-binding cassette domain-containing protein [Caulobacteraceae bacterium]
MAPPILALRDVGLADGPTMLFEGVNLALGRGERACLVGRNGAGKSTLLRLLLGEIDPDVGERITVPGLSIALVAQEPIIAGESLQAWAETGGAARHLARAALESMGLDPAGPTANLSGGETRRAALARAFAEEPDVLLLDEPTNHLDILAIETLEARLGRTRAALLLVSHDRAFLEAVSQFCFWLEHGRLRRLDESFVDFDSWAEGILAAEDEIQRRLAKAVEREERWLSFGVTARRARNEGRRRRLHALRAEKALRMSSGTGGPRLAVAGSPRSGALVIEARNITKSFAERRLVSDFSTRILRGEKIAILGPNGAGKTTLIGLLLGRIEPDSGEVRLGASIQLAFASQSRAELSPDRNLMDTLAPAGGDQIMVRGRPRHVAGYAADFMFRSEQLRQPVASLSGGERGRLLLALALARPSNLLVLDEPTNDLDMETLTLLEDLLADYEGTVILASHDRDFVERLATSTIALNGTGEVVETPGGWADFVSQNPGFFSRRRVSTTPRRGETAERVKSRSAKLSYREQRRLAELEAEIPGLTNRIALLENRLADPGLYARDPSAFERLGRDLAEIRIALAAAEDAWLELEALRESLALGAGEGAS